MKFILALCGLLVVSFAQNDPEWEDFKKKFRSDAKRKYKDGNEEKKRQGIFRKTMDEIKKHNTQFDAGKETFKMGVNQFTDMTTEEYNQIMNTYKGTGNKKNNLPYVPDPEATATTLDWRETKCITPIKDQGSCGSCYAFSAVGSIEFYNCRNSTNGLVALSEQNIVDCTVNKTEYGNVGCKGGFMKPSFKYVVDNGGISKQEAYPYEAKEGACRYRAENKGGSLKGYVSLPSGDLKALKNALAARGVISIAYDAGQRSFKQYASGVYRSSGCSTTRLNHAVVLVGYGNDGKQDYWLLKNSWGESFGMKGYFHLLRNAENTCGIATDASYPVF